jgi:hypothetical protein
MEYESVLFESLRTRDPLTLKKCQLALMESPAGCMTVCDSWVEVILAWHICGETMDPSCAEKLIEKLTPEHLEACTGTIYDQFLPAVANRVLGTTVFDDSTDQPTRVDDSYAHISRAVAFGSARQGWLPPYLDCARKACRLIESVNYGPAIHALCCLKAWSTICEENASFDEAAIFLKDARAYLGWASAIVGNSRIMWELAVYDHCQPL